MPEEKPLIQILCVTDSRDSVSDESGRLAGTILAAYARVAGPDFVSNSQEEIRKALEAFEMGTVGLLVTIGGTGISKKDQTIDVVRSFIKKELPGFGEYFRKLSMDEIGTNALLSRCTAGVTAGGKFVMCLPGSKGAVKLALEKLLIPQLKHIAKELSK